MEIDHINGDKQDNRLANLQLVTCSENCLKSFGVLTFRDAEYIRSAHKNGDTKSSLARKYHVSHRTIDRIVTNKTYNTQPLHEQNAHSAKQQLGSLDAETLSEICAEHQHGASYQQLADRHHLTVTAIKTIIRGGNQ